MMYTFHMTFAAFLILIAGFFLLVKGGDFVVHGASSLAKRYHVPELLIGLTVVSFGTSLPELMVNSFASFEGKSDIIFGNIIGSNLCNLLLILGVSSLFKPFSLLESDTKKETTFNLICILGLMILLFFNRPYMLSRIDALLLLAGFIFFMFRLFQFAKAHRKTVVSEIPEQEPVLKASIHIIAGCIMLPLGGNLVIRSATMIATSFGLSEALISLFMIALGTSLPELFTTLMAAIKHKSGMALGNIVGSNIFNLLFILGVSGLIKPIVFNPILWIDLWVLLGVTALFLMFIVLDRYKRFERWHGVMFLLVYTGYIGFAFYRG